MSRLDDNYLENPAVYFADWDSDNKCFKYFKKYAEPKTENGKIVKGENVFLKLPYTFLVLDMLYTIKGYNDYMQQGYYSNEVKDLKNDTLNVKLGKTSVAIGKYSEVMAQLRDAKFCQSVYIAVKHNKELVIANLQLKGAAVSAWIEFVQMNRKEIYKKAVVVKGFTEARKGKTEYTVPTFELTDVTPETNAQAKKLCEILAEYHKQYFANKEVTVAAVEKETHEQQLEKGEITDKLYRNDKDVPPPHSVNDEPPLTQEEEDDQLPF